VGARSRTLLRTAYLLTGDHQLAEDLLQTALVKTYLAWDRVRVDPEAYVRRVLVTTSTSWWRRRWHSEEPTERLPERSGPVGDDAHEERGRLWPHLRALPARQRAVVVLRYYEDLPEAEIAALMGCSAGTVKSQAHRAISTLRRRLDEENEREVTTGRGHA
jgi:RNA polymerase sigma-70 factor (sigma-E family)